MSEGMPRRAGERRLTSRRGNPRDRDGGPVVRPYALTAGRTRPTGSTIDLVSSVSAVAAASHDGLTLEPEHRRLLRLCRTPTSVADLASALDLPLGVVRVLIADLRDHGLVTVDQPARAGLADVRILKEVADALRKL
jgi:DNA-binding transcriptional ArsR family regulator